ncbi:vWA domain-containing protein [Rhizobium leguminosarum]|uniref:vWA domain-containing protein n=1 Tax=Rhizobium leguminosarum TaxID=384 RepID=UPI00103C272F|nr:VWA domain-containing protein [Rhizobium leguminosarum]MBB4331621.1 Ca-activated chloride channel family protein [Rhizobium leguminosarum]MBB4357100.1 Ca-activated chloride channel family protein [Rhizobium leguminosarum]MBB4551660.1 Ca-activated chloride channel family protein [Rhizobium leguminosarum]MBB4564253.1 Ca-activated chloride channel family protein [Rhizobium leguminosarum]TBZ57162.1 VWA domain-containing protein [Rhizobium leguminosarum bv. viciae]
MYQLDLPWLLLTLPAPLLVWWLLPPHREMSASIRLPFFSQVAEAAGVRPTDGSVVARRTWPQLFCEGLAWCLVVLALARPQFVEPPIEKVEPQRDILLALDLSQSMDAKDFPGADGKPLGRVEAVKQVVADFVGRRPGDRIGLVAFGDAPYPLAPFTMDHALVQTMIADAVPGMAGPRTSLGDALGLAIRMFEKTTVPEKVLIVLTDGNDTASRMPPLKAAEIAKSKGVVVHTVGIGDPAATGEDKLDTATLQKIAARTGGRYYFGGDQAQLVAIYDALDQITPEDQKNLSWRPRVELFQWPLLAAVLVLSGYQVLAGAVGFMCRRAAV